MGLKLLHTADWHLDASFAAFPEEQRETLRRERGQLPRRVAEVCRREGCRLLLLAGDIFDGAPRPATVRELKEILRDLKIPVFLSPGNHDPVIPGSPWEEIWPENVHIFRGSMESVSLPELDVRIWGAGYQSMDCPPLLENFRAEGPERYQIGLLHGDPRGGASPYCPVTAAQVRSSGLTLLALGHVHDGDQFRAGSTLCAWPGTPMGRGWEETGERYVNLITLDREGTLERLPIDGPRFYTHTLRVEGSCRQALEKALPAGGSQDFYRITLTGWADPEDLGDLALRYPNLALTDRTRPREELWRWETEDSLRGECFRRLKNRPEGQAAAEILYALLTGEEVALP